MVVVSILSALAVLGASVDDETGSHEDALYRQRLVAREEVSRSREEQVTQDLALFGSYEQRVARAQDLRGAAVATSNRRLARALRSRAERELAIGAALYHDFQVLYPQTGKPGGPSYDPSAAYATVSKSAVALHADVNPAPHRLEARSARQDGVGMAGVAALFLVALVLFTVAQVYAATKSVKPPPMTGGREPPTGSAPALPPVRPAVLGIAYAVFGIATAATVGGIVLGVGIAS